MKRACQIALLSCVFHAGACGQDTAVLLEFHSQRAIPQGADTLEVTVRSAVDDTELDRQTYPLAQLAAFPATLEIVPSANTPEEILVRGALFVGHGLVAEAEVPVAFVQGDRVEARITLVDLRSASCTDLTLSGSSLSSSPVDVSYVAANVLDNDYDTRWSSFGKGAWIQTDLGATKQLCAVSIAWHEGSTRKSAFEIGVSDDATTFTTAYAGQSSGTTLALENYTLPTISGRYVRVIVNGNTISDWASITELRVGDDDSTPMTGPANAGVPPGTILTPRQFLRPLKGQPVRNGEQESRPSS